MATQSHFYWSKLKVMEKTLHKRAKGNTGENIACTFLKNKGFDVLCRNYQKKWGEIDIVARKDNVIHFFEVKSVTVRLADRVSNIHRPEDNVDGWKVKHLRRMIETYLSETSRGMEVGFQFHVLCVYMNMHSRRASVKWLKNIII